MLKNNPVPVWVPASPVTRKGSLFFDRYMLENRLKSGRFENITFASRRWPDTRANKVFSPFFFLSASVDSCTFSSLSLLIHVLTFCNYRVISVAWSKDGKLASGSIDSMVKIWSVGSTGTLECESMLTGHSDWSFFKKILSSSVDSCTDFLQIQCGVGGVEPQWKANCQRQSWLHHQDLGLAIWRLPVDPDWA